MTIPIALSLLVAERIRPTRPNLSNLSRYDEK